MGIDAPSRQSSTQRIEREISLIRRQDYLSKLYLSNKHGAKIRVTLLSRSSMPYKHAINTITLSLLEAIVYQHIRKE